MIAGLEVKSSSSRETAHMHQRSLLLFLLAATSFGATSWTQLNPTGSVPPGCCSPVFYDSASNRLITFGGLTAAGRTNDTRVLSNANGLGGSPAWTQLSPSGGPPPARNGHVGVLDSANNRLVIFGGYGGGPAFNDVWVLTNANGSGGTPQWSQLSPGGPAPAARIYSSAVYDPASNRMMIFGGCPTPAFCSWLNDTWVLINANGLGGAPQWIQLSPVGSLPSQRYAHDAGYDPGSNRMLIFGGSAGPANNDTWVLTNANGLGGTPQWIQLSPPNQTLARYNAPGVYNPSTNQFTVTLGITPTGPSVFATDAWTLDNANGLGVPDWHQLTPSGGPPPGRDGAQHGGALDTVTNRLIIFGGSDAQSNYLNDVWVLALADVTDTTPPVISFSQNPAPMAGWNNTNVTVTWTVGDPESSIASSSGCNTSMLTSETAGSTLTCSATNGAGLTNSVSVTVKIDKTPPSVALTTPASGASYLIGSPVAAAYSCSDALSGVASCAGPVASGANINTANAGQNVQFTVAATDVAGNTVTTTNAYNVIYNFAGFLPPIDNLPVLNSVRAGRTVPVKWQLRDASGSFISDLATFTSLVSSPIACDASPTNIVGDDADMTGGTTLRYDATANQFVYNWQTSSSWTGCRLLQLTLRDGTAHLAKFSFR